MYVIVTNPEDWHRDNLQSNRENTGNLKMKFEWVPCQVLDLEWRMEEGEGGGTPNSTIL